VGGRVREFEDAGDDVEFLVLLFLVEVQPVIRMKFFVPLSFNCRAAKLSTIAFR
jgi:hypothetical protein